MSQTEQFFQAVLENPEDNTLRLVYADWLEDCGDPRGELIRVQVELEQTPHADLYWRTLKNRETELLDEHLADWLGPSARRVWKGFAEAHYQPFFAERGSCRLHRGFRETARMRAKTFLMHAEHILQTLPLRELHVFLDSSESQALARLAACPQLAKIRYLTLDRLAPWGGHYQQTARETTQLFHSENLADLESLRCDYGSDTQSLTRPLIQSPVLTSLKRLDLRMMLGPNEANQQPPARREGIIELADAKRFPNLEELLLIDHRLTHAMIVHLMNADWFPQLTLLDLTGNAMNTETVRLLCNLPVCPQLKTLRLSRRASQSGNAYLQAAGCRSLAQADFSQLEELTLQYQNLETEELSELLKSTTLGNLHTLDLSGNQLFDEGAHLLASAEVLGNLRVLKLDSCSLGDEALGAIAHSPHLKQLEQLFVGGNTFQEEGIAQLLDSPLMEHLRTLSFCDCHPFVEKPITLLSKSESVRTLTELDLTGHRLTANRAKKLMESPHLSELAHLSWYQPPVGQRDHDVEAALEAHWPGRVRL